MLVTRLVWARLTRLVVEGCGESEGKEVTDDIIVEEELDC